MPLSLCHCGVSGRYPGWVGIRSFWNFHDSNLNRASKNLADHEELPAVAMRATGSEGPDWGGYKPLMRNRTGDTCPTLLGYTAGNDFWKEAGR